MVIIPASSGRGRLGILRWRLLRRELIINLIRALFGRARAEAGPVAFEDRALLDGAELQAEADVPADVQVGRREAAADQIIAACGKAALERVEHRTVAAITCHTPAFRRHLESHDLIEDGSLEWSG